MPEKLPEAVSSVFVPPVTDAVLKEAGADWLLDDCGQIILLAVENGITLRLAD